MTPSSDPKNHPRIAGAVLPLQRAEELIAQLVSVVSCRITITDTGQVDTIHVLTSGEVPAKAMVRNIESALMAQLGLKVDHRKISVAATVQPKVEAKPEASPAVQHAMLEAEQALADARVIAATASAAVQQAQAAVANRVAANPPSASGTAAEPASAIGRKFYFEDVEVRRSRAAGMTCRVTLRRGAETYVGEATSGVETERARVELAARAALAAIAMTDDGKRRLALEGVQVVDAFDRAFAMVGVTVRVGREATLMTGTCEVKDQDGAETAAVLAVLDATNRWVGME
ncbi:MAG: hypothetical protein K2X99_05465 [Gemmatimonadaceae bacterium]|nr:hypothetical protein [Gemmatimonadaceae bacterium]